MSDDNEDTTDLEVTPVESKKKRRIITLDPMVLTPKAMTPLEFAITQLGVKESGGSNRGPEVDEYLRSVGLDPTQGSYAWCVAGVYYSHKQCGVKIPRVASVKKLWDLSQDKVVQTPEPGCVFIMLRPDGKGHCGIVETVSLDGASVNTVEFNTNAEGSREGDTVARKKRANVYVNQGYLKFY